MICTRTCLLTTGLALAGSTTALADFPQWEDRPMGESYFVADMSISNGVPVHFTPVHYPAGTTHAGHAKIAPVDGSCNSGNRLELAVMTANFDFDASIGALDNPAFKTRHNGGMINLSINGSGPVFGAKWADFNGMTIGSVVVNVISGGFSGDCTQIMLEGTVKRCGIALEEGWVDGPIPCDVPTYDDLTLGSGFSTGAVFVTDGIPCKIDPFLLPDGSWFSGSATVAIADLSCGIDFELETWTCVATHDFSGFGGATGVSFRVGETGGEVNLFINGSGACMDDWLGYDGLTFGGVQVKVLQGGLEYDCTEIELIGLVDSLGIGGQEHAIDCIEWTANDNGGGNHACATYDDMHPMPGAQYFAGDTFLTDGILCEVRPQRFPDGSVYTSGYAFAAPSMLACGSGQELACSAAAVDHRFADSIGPLEEVRITVADHGGQINFEINGEFHMPGQYIDLDGMLIGGVTVTVLSGGRTGECTELLLEGSLENLLVGGGQHFADCLTGELGGNQGNPGDFNNDGIIDGVDLAVVLGAWGQSGGDVNGDNTTDGADLSMILGLWTGN
jgi:hypothetical protein